MLASIRLLASPIFALHAGTPLSSTEHRVPNYDVEYSSYLLQTHPPPAGFLTRPRMEMSAAAPNPTRRAR